MELMTCKTCAGSLIREGNYYVCEACGNKFEIDRANDINAVQRANAWEALRQSDYEKATELFEEILLKDKSDHEAYWGKSLAKASILYVTDLQEGKKVPTCNNITENSFLQDKDVQKAISYAPADVKTTYQQQAQQIEKIRIEWLEKARKEPPYDVFISYKDSDKENGIDRTQDSVDAMELYNLLKDKGYQVFYSRITLRDKISEQYEPYIYNALKTAKVMIVFGEKPEYFSAVWLKNEWSRFITMITKGEKHKNSLVVVYKNMNPNDLPVVLKSRQCMNMSDLTFLTDLERHIKRVVDDSKQAAHLDRVEIQGGQISKKSSQIKQETLQTREIGKGAIAETSIGEKQMLDLAKTYIKAQQWAEAQKLIDDILFSNPSYAEAILCSLFIKYKTDSVDVLCSKFVAADYPVIEKILNCADKDYAANLLNALYSCVDHNAVDKGNYEKLLRVVLPFNYEFRQKNIEKAFAAAIQKGWANVFDLLLTTLDKEDVDTYIAYNLEYAKQHDSEPHLKNVLNVEEGNIKALKHLFQKQVDGKFAIDVAKKTAEDILKYSTDTNQEIHWIFTQLQATFSTQNHCRLVKEVLKYYNGDLAEIKTVLIEFAMLMIENKFFTEAEELLRLVLSVDAMNANAYWGLCLIKTGATSQKDVQNSDTLLKSIPEYTKYLTLVDEKRRMECIKLSAKQEEAKEARAQAVKAAKEEKKKQAAAAEAARLAAEQKAKQERATELARIGLIAGAAVLAVGLCVGVSVSNAAKGHCKLKLSEDGSYYIVTGKAGFFAKKVNIPDEYKGKPVQEIKKKAFQNWKSTWIKEITVGKNVTTIGEDAFYGPSPENTYYNGTLEEWCNIDFYGIDSVPSADNFYVEGNKLVTELVIPESVTQVMPIFNSIKGITSIVIPDTVTSIYKASFQNCSGLKYIEIGDGLKTIGEGVFSSARKLETVVISKSVTRIDAGAFGNCDNVKQVYYEGTEDEWNKISKDWDNHWLYGSNRTMFNASRYYYSEEEPTGEGNYWHYDEQGNIIVWEK